MKTSDAFCLTISKLTALLLAYPEDEPYAPEARKALIESQAKISMVLDRDEDKQAIRSAAE